MDQYFEKFIENISLSFEQRKDAKKKYIGVCKSLNKEFYDLEYSKSVKFLFGSYKKKTTISSSDKDVDVIFKIPKEKFDEYRKQENGPSNLLTKIKDTLKDTYSTTDKIKNWTKVVLVDFKSFKVEILPALEQKDGRFTIPNSGQGEDWIINFNPKEEIDNFRNSNNDNNGLTRKLIKIIKKWKLETSNVNIKSYILDNYVIDFLDNYSLLNYPKLILNFFEYLYEKENTTNIETAKNRAEKAYNYYKEDNFEAASKEYRKIFSSMFPKNIDKSFSNIKYQTAPNEQFIEDMFPLSINKDVVLDIKIYCKPKRGGFMHRLLVEKIPLAGFFKDNALEFDAIVDNLTSQYQTRWKVRNFGYEAEENNKLRGEIMCDNNGLHKYKDNTAFYGEHFLECYVIKDDICIAKKRITVPVNLK